jgi:pimeloyl-ACP methyl ester carboxylesterase
VPFRVKVSLWILGLLAFVVLIGPLLIPVVPLSGLVGHREAPHPGSAWVQIAGSTPLEVHVEAMARGEALTTAESYLPRPSREAENFLLLHGFGSSTRTWSEVLSWLSETGLVVAYDRPAFGLTERPMGPFAEGANPYAPAAQVGTAIAVLDELGIERAVLFGHSAGGTIAVQTALQHPERVTALVLVAPAVFAGGGTPAAMRTLLQSPQFARLGPLIARQFGGEQGEAFLASSFFDERNLSDEILAAYRHPLQIENWDRALWELVKSSRESELAAFLPALQMPVLVITGADDVIVPAEQSRRLVLELSGVPEGADYVEIAQCGHLPHEECHAAFRAAVEDWLGAQGLLTP